MELWGRQWNWRKEEKNVNEVKKEKEEKEKENFSLFCVLYTRKISLPFLPRFSSSKTFFSLTPHTVNTHIHNCPYQHRRTLSEFFTHAKVGNSMKIVCVIFGLRWSPFSARSFLFLFRNDMNRKLWFSHTINDVNLKRRGRWRRIEKHSNFPTKRTRGNEKHLKWIILQIYVCEEKRKI